MLWIRPWDQSVQNCATSQRVMKIFILPTEWINWNRNKNDENISKTEIKMFWKPRSKTKSKISILVWITAPSADYSTIPEYSKPVDTKI